mmetsp:Transcript_65772/g.152822  ORF Transcript_65772/g.152822 Transcript_65772/m.152822 type:complete len:262 (+) Transcript_65772:774-1559(+)
MQWEADGPRQQLRAVLLDFVAGCEHSDRGGSVATSAVGLVHDRLQEVSPVHVGPVPLLWESRTDSPTIALKKAVLPQVVLHLLPQHVTVELACWGVPPETGVRVDFLQGLAVPLCDGAGAPAKLHHGQLRVEAGNLLGLRLQIQGLVAALDRHLLPQPWGYLGRQLGSARLDCRRLGTIVATKACAVRVAVPAHHSVAAVRHVVLLPRVCGVSLKREVGERKEAEVGNIHLKAFIVNHGPSASCPTCSDDDVGVLQRYNEL